MVEGDVGQGKDNERVLIYLCKRFYKKGFVRFLFNISRLL